MFTTGILFFVLAAHERQPPRQDATVKAIEQSGRCTTIAENPDERVSPPKQLPPAKPPMLNFRLYETKGHHGNTSGLMLDDAGH